MDKQEKCRARWAPHKRSRVSDLRRLWWAYQHEGTPRAEKTREELGELNEYGLCFDYVAPKTFTGQREGYWRYQISYGGPSEEFRFYSSGPEDEPYRISFVFLDWFDGHERKLQGEDEKLLLELWNWFSEMGSTQHTMDEAQARS